MLHDEIMYIAFLDDDKVIFVFLKKIKRDLKKRDVKQLFVELNLAALQSVNFTV